MANLGKSTFGYLNNVQKATHDMYSNTILKENKFKSYVTVNFKAKKTNQKYIFLSQIFH